MSILVLGASGQIGAYTVQDLLEFCGEKDVIASSRKMANVKKAMDDLKLAKKTKLMELDANDVPKVLETIKKEKVQSVINCAWYQTAVLSIASSSVQTEDQFRRLRAFAESR